MNVFIYAGDGFFQVKKMSSVCHACNTDISDGESRKCKNK